MVTLSVLDQSPIRKGGTAAEALANTIDLARHAERLGYSRYWLAEHHNTSSFAGSAPEVMIAAVAGATSHIHVGSAGVMLPHYSPLKVAELFRLLETLYPGRIDLGLGRAPGSDQRTARALQPGPQAYPIDVFPQQVELLIQFLEDSIGLGGEAGGFPIGHPYTGIHATPRGPGLPKLWMLGSGLLLRAFHQSGRGHGAPGNLPPELQAVTPARTSAWLHRRVGNGGRNGRRSAPHFRFAQSLGTATSAKPRRRLPDHRRGSGA
jgi:alkanesulfonate monooxygenase SsuD/methylene tetrahydromethanopterin reductase-like flavin-dependent oxidoreductase (luciferase family)